MKTGSLRAGNWPFYLYVLAVLGVYLFYNVDSRLDLRDDAAFGKFAPDWSFVQMTWRDWSSRVLINILITFFLKHHFLFRLVNCACLFGIWWGGCRLLNIRDVKLASIFLLACFLFNIRELNTAGMAATQINYWWPTAFSLAALACYKIWLERRDWRAYAAALLFIIIAANQEQYAVALFILFFGETCRHLFAERRPEYGAVVILAILAADLVLVCVCPGNLARYQQEITTWFPNWAEIGFWSKMAKNLVFCGQKYFFGWCSVSLFFSLALLCALPKDCQRWLIWYIPPACQLGWLAGLTTANEKILLLLTCLNLVIYILGILKIAAALPWRLLILFILATGFVSRLMLAFSPTIFASGFRTFTIFDFTLIFAAFMLVRPLLENANTRPAPFGIIMTLSLVQEGLFIRYLLTDFNQ